ncbi:MAG: LacI family DNA-binding transcriptional regulator [Anaerolineae bacterium]
MATLKDIAAHAKVSILTAYRALSGTSKVPPTELQAVRSAAQALNYTLGITIRDVAALAGVSIATVSYVMNDSYPVSAETRTRVLEAASALNYRPNINARSLQASRTKLIGYGWFRINTRLAASLTDHFAYWMAQAAEMAGYHILSFAHPDENPIAVYDDLIATARVDGFILANTNHNDVRIRHLLAARIPFASFGRANEVWDFPYVDVDGHRGMSMAVEHLLALGHRKIGMIAWPEGSLSGDGRTQGYLDALQAAGISPYRDWLVREANTGAGGYQAAAQLMSLNGNRPSAIVCISDLMAIGAMNYLNHAKIRVGEDVALTGFDDDPLSELVHPPLTSLRQPIEQIAAQVVELLLAELDQVRLPNRQRLIAPELIIRASSDPTGACQENE